MKCVARSGLVPMIWDKISINRRRLVHEPLCSATVTWKGSTFLVKQGLVFSVTMKNATAVIPESGFVRKYPTRVETWLYMLQIMATKTPKPWNTFWYNEQENYRLSTNGDEAIMMMWI